MILARLKQVEKRRDREHWFRLCVEDLTIETGEHLAITGPSGCGKSTLLDLLGMILRPESGSFSFCFGDEPTDVMALWNQARSDAMARLRMQYMGYVLQTGELLPYLTVEENILLTATIARRLDAERIGYLQRILGIEALAHAMPQTLSLGERQRVAIARALAPAPRLLLADEPTAALDPCLARSVMRLFLEVAEKSDTAIVMVSHDHALVHEFAFREVSIGIREEETGVTATLAET